MNPIRNLSFILCFLLLSSLTLAQNDNSDENDIMTDEKNEHRFFFMFDNSRTFIRGSTHVVNGFKTGVEVNNNYRIGLGFYSLSADIIDPIVVKRQFKPDTTRLAQLDMGWLAVTYEYIFYSKKKWEFSVPVNLGLGSSYYEYFEDSRSVRVKEGPIMAFETGANGEYKVIRWAGLGFGLGFRAQLISNAEINEKFNSPFYVFKVKLYLGEIYRTVFPKKEG